MNKATRILALLTILGLCSSAPAMDGSGTQTDPYIITNVDELQAMRDNLSAHYQLGNDIDASDTATWNAGAGFEPVGTDSNPFTGVFDGTAYVITGLYINRPGTDGVGLFGFIRDGAEVMNVGLIDVDVTARRNSGPLVGHSSGSSVFGCSSGGTITGSYNYQMRLGGLIGVSSGADSFVSQSHSSVTVVATGGAHQVGGLAGYNGHGSVMSDCYATGDVTGSYKVGGLVGDNIDGSEGTLIIRCYSAGRVTGSGGGLVGFNWRGGVTQDSYWDIETSGKSTSSGGTGMTTAEMMQQATFVNWDFDEIWDIDEGQSYPFFMEPRVLEGLEIVGPDEAPEDSQTQYSAIALYDNNSTADVTDDALWSVEPNVIADIEAGLLTTEKIFQPEELEIYAQYTEDGNTFEANRPVSLFAICPSGSALQFDGLDDYVSFGTGPTITGTEPFAVSAWVKTGSAKGNAILTQRAISSANGSYGLSILADGRVQIHTYNGGYGLLFQSDVTVNNGLWHHIAAVRTNSTDGEIYVDGRLAGTGSGPAKSLSNVPVWSGRGFTGPFYFDGLIDDVRIYDRALLAQEIVSSMHTRPEGSEPNLIGYWDFDEGAGQVAHDTSGSGNDGQLGSSPDIDDSDPNWAESDAPIGICTLEGLVERNVNEALEIKLNMLDEILEALAREDASVNILSGLFGEAEYGHLDKTDIIKAKQEIHSAIQSEEQAIHSMEKSVGDLEDSLETLASEDGPPDSPPKGSSVPERQLKTLVKPAVPPVIAKPPRK